MIDVPCLIKRNFNRRSYISSGSIELLVQDLVMIYECWSIRSLVVLHAGVSHAARWMEERSTKLLTSCIRILSVLGALRAWPLSTSAISGHIMCVVRSISTVDTIASGGCACRLILCVCSVAY